MSVKIKADIRHWLRELDKKYFFVMLGFAVMVYFPLISQRLVNTFDGLWNGSWFIGGFWELSIGRWLWCVADAVRFGVQTEPLNALLTLSMMVLGITLLRRLFVERDNALTYFAGMAAISGAAVGVQLSYRYMSPIFGLSFLFAVLAAYWVITTTHAGAAVGCGAVILALSLGLYQANLAVFCMILLAYLLRLLFQNAEPQKTGVHIAKSLGSAAAGMVLYWLVLKLVLALCRIDLTSYNGAAEISVKSILFGLPNGILQAYRIFGIYFFRNAYRHNTLQPFGLFAAVLAMLAVWFLCRFVRMARSGKTGGLLLGTAALLALSLACNAMMLITSEAVWLLQMGEGLNLFVPVCLLLLEGTRTNQPMVKKYVRAARTGAVVLAVLVVYGNVCSAVIDQEAMYEGRKTLKSMSDHIADDLMSSGYFDDNEQLPVLFVGRPSSNSSFMKREYYLYANPYAQMGRFWLNDYSARASWKAVFRDITPAKLKHCSVEQYGELYSRTELEQMPVYPQEGYIQQIDGVVVVKISDDYKVDKEFAPLIDLGELFQLIMDDINDS